MQGVSGLSARISAFITLSRRFGLRACFRTAAATVSCASSISSTMLRIWGRVQTAAVSGSSMTA